MPPGDDTILTTRSGDGLEIAYDVLGAGPAVVFVHGWAGRRSHWDGQRPLAASHTVVRVDLGGHGASGRGRTRWTVSRFAEDVVAVVDTLALDAVVLVGHSLGGSVIALVAERLGERVRGVMGVDTWSALGTRHSVSDIERSVVLPEMRVDFAAGSRRFVEAMCGPTTPRPLVERLAEEVASMAPGIALAVLDEAIRTGPEDVERALDALDVPKAAISSATFRPKDPATLAAYGIDNVVLAGTGHYLMLERPAEFNALLAGVLAAMHPAAR